MPPKVKSAQKEAKKKKRKRKGSSPSDKSGQTGFQEDNRVSDQHKRTKCTDQRVNTDDIQGFQNVDYLFNTGYIHNPAMNNQSFNMMNNQMMNNPMTPMNGAMGSQGGSPIYSMSQPPMMQNYAQLGPQNAGRPEWANELVTDIKSIKSSVGNVEKKVDKIDDRLKQLEAKMSTMDVRVRDVENSCTFISAQYDKQRDELKEAKKQIGEINKQCQNLEDKAGSLAKEKGKIESKLIDLESRTMRENLLFFGLPENDAENCTDVIKKFCAEELQMDDTFADELQLDRAHRLGGKHPDKIRPIVVKFHQYLDRERVRQKGYELIQQLKAANQAVRAQWPREVMERRIVLYPIMQDAEKNGKTVKLVKDKLFINGQEYVPQ